MRAVIAVIALIALTGAADAKRTRVYINKPSQPISTAQYPLAVVPPVVVAFDLARRTSCEPRVVIAAGTGKGDPGFDPAFSPAIGNWLVPAIYRSQCKGTRPKWYGW